MKISKYFKLNKSQAELDFVDIDPNKDLSLFLNPHILAYRTDRWSESATRTIRSFFQHLITLLSSGRIEEAQRLFSNLYEPNETCLGLSRKKPKGRGVGPEDTNKIFKSILQSKAIQSGLVEDLEDCTIFVENFGRDKLSDMTTNIIRKHLIEYTQAQCKLWNIPLQADIASGHYWNRSLNHWESGHTQRLVVNGKPYLLVPKGVVTFSNEYTAQKFHTHFVLNFLKEDHLRLNTSLVQVRYKKDGSISRRVTKKSIKESESPGTKRDLNDFVAKYPHVFQDFKKTKAVPAESLSNEEIADINISQIAAHLHDKLINLSPGSEYASAYHNLMIGILEFLFYPELTCPIKENEIHQGRKRIDITFDNSAREGIFYELRMMPSQYIMIECKNYTDDDPNNPDLDQLAGRFSPNRGKVGILVCRKIDNMDLFCQRCSDTHKDGRGLILPVTDDDLVIALKKVIEDKIVARQLSDILRNRRRKIQMN